MITKETFKQFENIDFDIVKEYLPSEKVILKLKKDAIIKLKGD